MGVFCKIESSKIVDGRWLMCDMATLTQWDSPLGRLENGYHMFANTGLTSWQTDMPQLISAGYMFEGSQIETFNAKVPKLIDSNNQGFDGTMFGNCHYLSSVYGDFTSLKNGVKLCYLCNSLTDFRGNLKNLGDGYLMFNQCKLSGDSIAYIAGSLPTIKSDATYDDLKYESYSGGSKEIATLNDYGKIDIGCIYGSESTSSGVLESFDNKSISSYIRLMQDKGWTVFYELIGSSTMTEMPFLTNASSPIEKSINLTPDSTYVTSSDGFIITFATWTKNITQYATKVLNGIAMNNDNYCYCLIATDKIKRNDGDPHYNYNRAKFSDCFSTLKTWDSDLGSLEDGEEMFWGCEYLTSFDGDLSSLTNGNSMFYASTALTTFKSDLSSLEFGYHMFGGSSWSNCNLSAESVKHILESIPTYPSGTQASHELDIGMNVNAIDTFNEITGASLSESNDGNTSVEVHYNGWIIRGYVNQESKNN